MRHNPVKANYVSIHFFQGIRRYRFLGGHRSGGFQFGGIFWRLTVFHFLAVSLLFVVPGTGKFAGILVGGLKYGGFSPAVPATANVCGTFPGTAKFGGTFLAVMKFGGTSGGSSKVCLC